jgi:ATP-dependent HslUV protease subunit HslV
MKQKIRSTTILGIVYNGVAALGGDGQVSLGNTVMKHNALKLRKISNGKMLAIISKDTALVISGNGDVIEPDDKIVAIGSGGMYALAAAKMLKKFSKLSAKEITEEALKTASDICIYTNDKINVEVID